MIAKSHRSRSSVGICIAALALAAATACGGGIAAVVASNSSDSSSPAPIRLIRSDCRPPLDSSATDPFADPFENPSDIDPGTTIELAFSLDLDADSADETNFAVDVLHPSGAFVPVEFSVVPIQPPTRRLTLALKASTLLNGLYRVRASGVAQAGGASELATTTSFFLVREGEWSEFGEMVAFGTDGVLGGVAILPTPRGDAFASIETRLQVSNTLNWTESLSRSGPEGAFETPRLLYVGPNDSPTAKNFELNTGEIVATDRAACFQWREVPPGLAALQNGRSSRLYAAIGTVDLAVGEIDFGPTVYNTSSANTALRIDHSEIAGHPLLAMHVSMRSPMSGVGNLLVTAWWSFTGAGTTFFNRTRVYGSSNLVLAPQSPWSEPTQISDDTVVHNSWPYLVQFSDAGALALWWSSATDAGLSSGVADQYWVARSAASGVWQPGQPLPPLDGGTALPNITDVQRIDDDRALVCFNETGGSVGPTARTLRRDPLEWGPPTSPGGVQLITVPYASLRVTSPNACLGYGTWCDFRRGIYSMTPRAARIDEHRFLVNWKVDDSFGSDHHFSILDIDSMTWQTPVNFAVVAGATVRDFSVSVDQLGWATATWHQLDEFVTTTGFSFAMAARANIVAPGGLQRLSNAQSERISPADMGAAFPFRTNLHPSGALGVSWDLGVPNTTPPHNHSLLGTMFSRFR